MMDFSFFFMTTLGLIICQTVIFPSLPLFAQSFDILIIVVLYLSLAYSRYGAAFAIAAIGGIMDSISGVPFFHYIFSYLWIFLIVQLFKQLVFQRSVIFVVVVSLAAVAIQQCLTLFSVFVGQGQAGVRGLDYSLAVRQILWGGLFIPPSVWLMNFMRHNYVYTIRRFRRELVRKYME